MSVYFIAELGSNIYPYSRGRLEELVERAAWAGANAVKVQLFYASHFPVMEQANKIRYEFPRYEFEWYLRLARARGLEAGASVFDADAVRQCRDAAADFVKIASREYANHELLVEIRDNCTMPIYRSILPQHIFVDLRKGEVGLGCVPSYPALLADALSMVERASVHLGAVWGWSSHTEGYEDCAEAAQRGATVIEKHLCLSDDDVEAGWSLHPAAFKEMVRACGS